jgi:ATP-dependent helicase/nuclease subunit A
VENELITEEQAESVDISKILNFFNSNIGKRMIKSQKAYREVPFHMEIKSTEIYRDIPNDKYMDENIMVQGIIDCYFEENGEVILVDYKSDYFKKGEEKAIIDKYKIQIELYARAIEEITNKKVKEKYLYLFYGDKEVEVK